MHTPWMIPPPGEHQLRFVGDHIRFSLRPPHGSTLPRGWRAFLRTNIGRAALTRREVIHAHTTSKLPPTAALRDIPMRPERDHWLLELPLTEVGYFKAKAYMIDPEGRQHWPQGPDAGVCVHPDAYRTGNTIYCAFTRMFAESKTAIETRKATWETAAASLDRLGFAVIPPSGKLRDLKRELPHIFDTLGCRILHLLPVNPTPVTYARFGRFGSPYACQDLTAIDPALVEFDKRTTGADQFRELAYEVHSRGGRLFIDIVINHTGWGSALQENHPEWFVRNPDGSFHSPGAWGVTWEDLVELDARDTALWDELAEAFLTWCRRGVDGFRCDAGYKVPKQIWRYITARVHEEFPDTIFLLEGLGGAWTETETLLTEGGMQWAYSELFQEYSTTQVACYLDHALRQSGRIGLLVHYSETHDNARLAARGREWSLLRNRLCALTSIGGAFGFTCGVEWLAAEKIEVHQSRGLSWGNSDNIVAELSRLNRLLAEHPCFFDTATLTRLSPPDAPVYALLRQSADRLDRVLVLVNADLEKPQSLTLNETLLSQAGVTLASVAGKQLADLLDQPAPAFEKENHSISFLLEPGACHCLSTSLVPAGIRGDAYRKARARAAWGMQALAKRFQPEEMERCCEAAFAQILSASIEMNPRAFLAAISALDREYFRKDPAGALEKTLSEPHYPRVSVWSLTDARRTLPVPPDHWLLIEDAFPFKATLECETSRARRHASSIQAGGGHVACFPPQKEPADATLVLERYATADQHARGKIRFLPHEPEKTVVDMRALHSIESSLDAPLVLLTNGRGGMARICLDLGRVKSKYDCALGANLHHAVPVDRHVFVKRIRVWAYVDGFITPLNAQNLIGFDSGPPARWRFAAPAGEGRGVEIVMTADMLEGLNTTVLRFSRSKELAESRHSENQARVLKDEQETQGLNEVTDVRLTVRVDIEDRNFHWETKANGGAEHHFIAHTRPMADKPGFAFTPGGGRLLRVHASTGHYHHEAEWSHNLPHPVEQSRGQEGGGDAFSPGWFDLPLAEGGSVALSLCADADEPPQSRVNDFEQERRNQLEKAATRAGILEPDAFGRQLARAVHAFVVQRDSGKTVIAGYPWFLDWGRDSLICARGMLAAGMLEEVRQLLVVFGKFEKDGTLPNTIHGEDTSNRDTSDAPLWYGVVAEEAAALLGSQLYQVRVGQGIKTIGDVLAGIATGYIRGTPNGIRMDPDSGLIWSPSHFTWMDTNHPAGTPREGYPVEIQVLWIELLRQLDRIGASAQAQLWGELVAKALSSLEKYYWLEDKGWLADLLVARPGQAASEAVADNALRSNCLFAVSFGMLKGDRARRCVDAALRHLVIPGALRSLAPLPVAPPLPVHGADGRLLNNPSEPYQGRYEGDEDTRRKPAYHNGTAWTWTFPTFCEALAKAWDNSSAAIAAARCYLGSMDRLLSEGCVGQLPEVLDGDAPHQQRGCDAQAWGATEALRVWKQLQQASTRKGQP